MSAIFLPRWFRSSTYRIPSLPPPSRRSLSGGSTGGGGAQVLVAVVVVGVDLAVGVAEGDEPVVERQGGLAGTGLLVLQADDGLGEVGRAVEVLDVVLVVLAVAAVARDGVDVAVRRRRPVPATRATCRRRSCSVSRPRRRSA